mgnify:CR=1 FL=1|tara:strand:- start:2424 stop:2711 length:288 start_codon:yes stop_codon:yes gene_type:complete
MNEESRAESAAIEKFLPAWGQTVTHIIDFFFTRKEKHIKVVTGDMNTQFDKIILSTIEKAPMIAQASIAAYKEVSEIIAEEMPAEEVDEEQEQSE